MNKTALRKYARLIAEVGANVQKGQEVIVRSNVETAEFAYLVCEECYKLGAKEETGRKYFEFTFEDLVSLSNKK